ncbi:MAG: peptidoglycan DD-metalloendopeptidase family protein [Bacteroidales bacterium]|nr:peptidoglycan DD-metalloendopeptidase family protein [Bacteroidales bacterium]
MKNKSYKLFSFIIFSLISVFISCNSENQKESKVIIEEQPQKTPETLYGIEIDSFEIFTINIGDNQNLSQLLNPYGIGMSKIDEIVKASDSIFDLRKMRAGKPLTFFCERDTAKTVHIIVYEHTPVDYVVFDLRKEAKIYLGAKPVNTVLSIASGEIETSLWNAMAGRGYDPILSNSLSDIYAWSIDFFGLQVGDKFKMIYEEYYVDSTKVGFGKIHAAWFYHSDSAYFAIPFTQDSIESYYDQNGNSLRKAFLKAPLQFSRITSHFSNSRLHPILKIRRPHHGVDYAAPVGTPVMTIGDGKVISMGYSGGAGHMVKIQHNSNYATAYLHLSKYGPGIQSGATVKQGDIIGYVGSTGLSTGPHLDFRFYKNGQPVDPLKVEAPPVEPIKDSLMNDFIIVRDSLINKLELIQF